jgi:hypothetical protein
MKDTHQTLRGTQLTNHNSQEMRQQAIDTLKEVIAALEADDSCKVALVVSIGIDTRPDLNLMGLVGYPGMLRALAQDLFKKALGLARDPQWVPLRYQISDSEGEIVFVDGIGKMGLGIHSSSFQENGETITDYLITHIRSGYNVIDRLHCFSSEGGAKAFYDDLWAEGANFRLGKEGVKAQADIILPLVRGHIANCEAYWAGVPEGEIIGIVVRRSESKN